MSKQFYLTTAIDYVNGEPHLGHAYEKVITDIIARAHRSLGQEVFYPVSYTHLTLPTNREV